MRTFELQEEERQAREEEFLLQLWYVLNPYGNREKIEGRVLYVFFKLVYDPYWDGTQESMAELIEEATRLAEDIKQLQREQETAANDDVDEADSDQQKDSRSSRLVEVRD